MMLEVWRETGNRQQATGNRQRATGRSERPEGMNDSPPTAHLLPLSALRPGEALQVLEIVLVGPRHVHHALAEPDRKSTRLNSSHSQISYAVFCLKKKKRRKT